MAILNQYHKLRNIKMKRLSLLKQKLVETVKIWEKIGRIQQTGRKGSCMNKMTLYEFLK